MKAYLACIYMKFWSDCWQRFVSMLHLCACLDLMHLVSLSQFMLLNATLWLTVTHTFQSNRPNLADWSKGICITFRKCFCSLLTSNWEGNTGRLLYSCTNFTQSTSFFVISLHHDNIETNSSIGNHTSRVFTWCFEKIAGKGLFGSFTDVFFFNLLPLVSLLTIYIVKRNFVVYCHAYN